MERWEEIVDNTDMPSPGQHVFIWGAGDTSVLNHQGMLRENLYKEFRVEAFLDSKLAGTVFNGFQVFHPDILRENAPQETFVFISTTNEQVLREIEEECREINISYCLLDAAILKVRKEKYLLAVELMKTDSGSVYHTILRNRLLATGTDDLYAGESCFGIPEFCRSNPHDVVVDCGAYVGDSAERYIWRMPMFHKYIAIEPDLRNFQALQRRFNRLREEWGFSEEKLVALHGGVDEKSGFAKIDNRVGGLGSIAYNCSNETVDGVRFWALDDLSQMDILF